MPKNPKDSTRNFLENAFRKISRYKAKHKNWELFFYVNNKVVEIEKRVPTYFFYCFKKQYLRINLNKKAKYHYNKVFKTLKKERKDNPKIWKVISL